MQDDHSFAYRLSSLLSFWVLTAIVVREKDAGRLQIIGCLFSLPFLRVLAGFSLLFLLSGFLVWLFERKKNPEQFSGIPAQGIGSGFWCAVVT